MCVLAEVFESIRTYEPLSEVFPSRYKALRAFTSWPRVDVDATEPWMFWTALLKAVPLWPSRTALSYEPYVVDDSDSLLGDMAAGRLTRSHCVIRDHEGDDLPLRPFARMANPWPCTMPPQDRGYQSDRDRWT